MLDGTGQRAWHGRGVTLVGGLQLGGNHRAGIEIHRVLRLVRPIRAAIFPLGDLGIWISRAPPLGAGHLLALAIAVQPEQVRSDGRPCRGAYSDAHCISTNLSKSDAISTVCSLS